MQRDSLVLQAPYELWREEGVLHLIFNQSAKIGMWEIKEVLRLIRALDPVNNHPVLVLSEDNVNVSADARLLLMRSCKGDLKRTVGFVAGTLSSRITGDMFSVLHRPTFPFKVFRTRSDAFSWFQHA